MASTPEPLPSLPPSPGPSPSPTPGPLSRVKNEDDLARAWHDDEPKARLKPKRPKKGKGKGKGKERAGSESDEDEDESDEDEEDEDGAATGYPPTKEEEAESRRVAENLRRWEIAERQRRKAARESVIAVSPSATVTSANSAPSLFADLFRRDSRKAPLGGVGTHHALSTGDESVPLDELETPSVEQFSSPPTPEPENENPFETPNASRTSLNIPAHSAIMTESDTVPDDLTRQAESSKHLTVPPKRPTIQASSSFAGPGTTPPKKQKKQQPPPPKPLGLPPPKIPPPLTDDPGMDTPPEPVPAPTTTTPPLVDEREQESRRQRQAQGQEMEPQPPVRWWHEWLCGCGEGPDRGGEHQAGRTNPME
ncbi:hypothetical protein C8Q76DRAFT_19047 [Earliella scabrosa]|nr:hypothetical protein C8Q76DRAFT_19047 [Earliella scabrosa]